MVRVSGRTLRAERRRTSGCRSWRKVSFSEKGLRGSRCGRLKSLLLSRIPCLQIPVRGVRRAESGGHRRRGVCPGCCWDLPSLCHRFYWGLAPALEDEGGAQVARRGGDDGDRGNREDRADYAVEGCRRERGEENPKRVDTDGAAHDPRHQDVSFDLLGDEEEARDHERLPKTAHEERDQDRRDGTEKGSEDGYDLRDTYPQSYQERVFPYDEEGYGSTYDPHDGTQRQLCPEVLHQGALDGVEELDGVVAHRIGDGA